MGDNLMPGGNVKLSEKERIFQPVQNMLIEALSSI